MPLTQADRKKIIDTVKKLVLEKHINVKNPNQDYGPWVAQVDKQAPQLLNGVTDAEFESGMKQLLAALGSSHTAFFHQSGNDVPPVHAIHATLRAIDTAGGKRWMFLDVIEDGGADRAGIRPGQLLSVVDGAPVAPPARPSFRIGATHRLEISDLDGSNRREVSIDLPNRAAKDRPPMIEPRSVSHRMIAPDIGYVRVASFPGAVGQAFAKSLDAAIADVKTQGATGLIVDLRGNVGGGLGSLRLMSYFCPGKVPVGHSLTRKRLQKGYNKESLPQIDRIPSGKLGLLAMALRFKVLQRDRSMVLTTEGLGPQPFHGRIVLITNEYTHSAAEMVASFVKENHLAAVVGETTAGEVLGGANFVMENGYRLRMPVAGWYTWAGECIEGTGIEPDVPADLSPEALSSGQDAQLASALRRLKPRREPSPST